ncbi:related to Nuclear segregation protein BFR1 [Saccharomycodes ludwigii]|uniref:Related to Nuclear segregation protein BFR1 n=1 Tax=Saccharomycodes ludwigii TaxID=36035 RepID=A0A376BAB5_9ASCO|nr:hypothetical protein SCDLUD_002127 [Saccharomycodes ludwigii]KAH3902307.1 hypothetical protein SCDLUD_002127 [Saccharomycodes ludwigii]SSD61602.1 related to Nuclear segregation protein BFR1 [Saccharomycodes ludwigii]
MSDSATSNKSNGNRRFRSNIKRPDVSTRDKKLELLNAQLKKINLEVENIRSKIDSSNSSPSNNKRQTLQTELKDIIKTQADLKAKRQQFQDKIKVCDSKLKKIQADIDSKLSSSGNGSAMKKYSSEADVKDRLQNIEDQMSSGELSIVEEKKLVKEEVTLQRLLKSFRQIEPLRKEQEALKLEISQLKSQVFELNPRDISTKFEKINNELNELREANSTVQNGRQLLFNKRTALYSKRDEIFAKIRQTREDFDNEFKAYRLKVEKEKLKREEEEKLSKLLEQKDSDLGKLQEKLIHAQTPAFTYELGNIENVLVLLDPTFVKPKTGLFDSDKTATVPGLDTNVKKVAVSSEGLVPLKTKKQLEPQHPLGKKGKKYKKHQNASSVGAGKSFALEPSTISVLAELDIIVPLNAEEVSGTVEQLKKKHQEYLDAQEEQTKVNIKAVEDKIAEVEQAYAEKEAEVKKQLEEKKLKEQKEKEEEEDEEEEEKTKDN